MGNRSKINSTTGKGKGLRFNSDKLRFDLVHPQAHQDMVEVLTYGANKYTVYDENGVMINDGANNWRNGLGWKSVIASLKRHISAIELGEDYDNGEKGSGLLHIAHAACNIHFLNAFYYDFPQGDDRFKSILNQPKIGLDIDEVLCGFATGWCEKYEMDIPTNWDFDWDMGERFKGMIDNNKLDDFYLSLKPLINPITLPFIPACYITSRPVDLSVTKRWLSEHKFPVAPVYSVEMGQSKVDVAKEAGIDIFIDDKFENFVELNNAGITCYLYDTSQNRQHDVGHLRIKVLSDLPFLPKK